MIEQFCKKRYNRTYFMYFNRSNGLDLSSNFNGKNMRHPNLTTLLLQMFLLLGSSSIFADEVTITAARDNSIFSEDGTFSNGKGKHLFSGTIGTFGPVNFALRRALIAFDVAGEIPAGSTITSATLTLNVSRNNSGASSMFVHRLLSDWGEGTSVAANPEGRGIATGNGDGDATWTHRFFSTDTWSTDGGDYNIVASASTLVGPGLTAFSWTSFALTQDVQSMLDEPANNFGWILIGEESAVGPRNAKRFDSLQSDTPANRPRLTVEFTPGAPDPHKMTGITVIDPNQASFEISFESSSSQVYELEFNPFITGVWDTVPGRTNIVGLDGTQTLRVTNSESSGDYRIIIPD